AYTLAAAYAGAAGALLAQTTAFVSLDVFEFHRSADVLLVLIIGGAGWLYGGIAGAVIYKLLQDGIATFQPQYWQFWIVLLLGEDITRLRPEARVRRGLVRTFQINQLFGDLTPLETLALAVDERLALGGDWRRRVGAVDAVSAEVEQVSERFGLMDVLER